MKLLAFCGRIGRELLGALAVILLVALLGTMPPVKVEPAFQTLLGYRVTFEAPAWGRALSAYWQIISQGTLGRDRQGHPIAPMIADRLAHSLLLLGIALALALLLGVAKGIWDFRQLRRGGLAPGVLVTGAVQGLPHFLAVLLVQRLAVLMFNGTGWRPFPVAWVADEPVRSMVFPVICLALMPWASVARLTSTALSQVWDEDYIRTARAKGLAERVVLYKHAFRNAVLLILEGLPNLFVIMVSNLLIVEYLFAYPGLTKLLKDAVMPLAPSRSPVPTPLQLTQADVPLLVASGITLCLVFLFLYTAVGALRRWADPRAKERDAA